MLESEKKLRISSLLSLSSSKHGTIAVRDLNDLLSTSTDAANNMPDTFTDILFDVLDKQFKCDESSLIYICGYVSSKYIEHISCDICLRLVMHDRTLELDEDCDLNFDYIEHLDRGVLKYPTLLCVLLVYKIFCCLQLCLSTNYETAFISCAKQRTVLYNIVKQTIDVDDYFIAECDDSDCACCGQSLKHLLELGINTFINIYLNNYTKQCNDKISAAGGKRRKLQTLK